MTRHYVKYDDDYNLIEFKETHNNDLITHYIYSSNGLTKYKWCLGSWEKFDYKDGNLVYHENSMGFKETSVFDDKKRLIEHITKKGNNYIVFKRFFFNGYTIEMSSSRYMFRGKHIDYYIRQIINIDGKQIERKSITEDEWHDLILKYSNDKALHQP